MTDDRTAQLAQLRIDRSPKRRGKIPWGLLMVILLLGAAGAGGYWYWSQNYGLVVIKAVTARAQAGGGAGAAAASLLDASGYVVPYRQATVASKILVGRVDRVLIEEGQAVQAGQLLATLEDDDLVAQRDQSAAALGQAQALLAQAKQALADAAPIFRREQAEATKGLISAEAFEGERATYDQARTSIAVQSANVAAAQTVLQSTVVQIGYATIRAPFAGVVTAKNVEPGEIISPEGTGTFTRSGIATIVDMNSLEAQVDVSETYINRVYAAQKVTIVLNAYPDWQIPGHVIAVIPTADQTTATVKVRIALEQRDSRILPEMGLHASFLQAVAPRSAPVEAALVERDAVVGTGDTGTVYVVDGDHVAARTVKLGAVVGSDQTILAGLSGGEQVAVGDLSRLGDGTRVRVAQ